MVESSPCPIKVVLVDDHELARQGVRNLFRRDKSIQVVGEAGNREDALSLIYSTIPHVVLLDIRLGNESGVDVAEEVRGKVPDTNILILSAYDCEQYVGSLARLGISGYLTKTITSVELRRAIHEVARGGLVFGREVSATVRRVLVGNEGFSPIGSKARASLTPREHEVLSYLSCGLRNSDVAREMGISLRTVETHVVHILVKLDARTRTQAVIKATTQGLL